MSINDLYNTFNIDYIINFIYFRIKCIVYSTTVKFVNLSEFKFPPEGIANLT